MESPNRKEFFSTPIRKPSFSSVSASAPTPTPYALQYKRRTVCDPQEHIYYLEQEVRDLRLKLALLERKVLGMEGSGRQEITQEVFHVVTPQMMSKVEEMVTIQVKEMHQEVFF